MTVSSFNSKHVSIKTTCKSPYLISTLLSEKILSEASSLSLIYKLRLFFENYLKKFVALIL